MPISPKDSSPEVIDAYQNGYHDGGQAAFIRGERARNILVGLGIILAFAAVVFGLWQWSQAAREGSEREQTLRLACVDEGGVWMPSGVGCVWSERAR